MQQIIPTLFFCITLVSTANVYGAHATVAVATNFKTTAEQLVQSFTTEHTHGITLVSGSTGKLFTQIVYGAPYDLFLAADRERPARLIADGLAVAESQYTYALGQLALLGQHPVDQSTLTSGKYDKLAIANPALAPYGRAAMEMLAHLQLTEQTLPKLVRGQNIGQAYVLVASGNAELGLVAFSMLQPNDAGNSWLVPSEYHAPVEQDLVLLLHGENNPAAQAFLAFIRSPTAADLIRAAGYLTPAS